MYLKDKNKANFNDTIQATIVIQIQETKDTWIKSNSRGQIFMTFVFPFDVTLFLFIPRSKVVQDQTYMYFSFGFNLSIHN